MTTGEGSDTIATGMITSKGIPATIDAIAMHGSLLDLRLCQHDCPAGERGRAMNDAALIERNLTMLWAIAVILLAMWLLGMVTSYTVSGFIHLLLVVAIIVVLIRLIQGRRPVL